MVDDFHGTREWQFSCRACGRFPGPRGRGHPEWRSDLPHDERHDGSIPGAGQTVLRSGRTYEYDGYNIEWQGVYDDQGRIQVAICHNMDLGDAWQYADDPEYPEKFASVALRVAVNYVTYAMTR